MANFAASERLPLRAAPVAREVRKKTRMKTQSLFKVTALIAVILGALVSAGCNTVDGACKDLERAGEKIQNAADK